MPWKKLNSPPRPPYYGVFKIRNTDLQFRSFSCRKTTRIQTITKCFAFHANALSMLYLSWIWLSFIKINNIHLQIWEIVSVNHMKRLMHSNIYLNKFESICSNLYTRKFLPLFPSIYNMKFFCTRILRSSCPEVFSVKKVF